MREVFGDKWPAKLATLVKDVDYVERKCFSTFKRVYRADILDSLDKMVEVNADLIGKKAVKFEDKPAKSQDDPHIIDDLVLKLFPNPSYVLTSAGYTVYVGGKGRVMAVGKRIKHKEGKLVL